MSVVHAESVTVKPGMTLDEFSKRCASQGIEVTDEVLLSVSPADNKTELTAANLDDNIVVIIAYNKDSQIVISIGAYFIPTHRTSKMQRVWREAKEITFNPDGTFSLRLEPIREKQP